MRLIISKATVTMTAAFNSGETRKAPPNWKLRIIGNSTSPAAAGAGTPVK